MLRMLALFMRPRVVGDYTPATPPSNPDAGLFWWLPTIGREES